MPDVFALPVFFVCFRETLECSIIISILLAWLKSTLGPEHDPVVYKRLRNQIWFGTGAGLLICLCVGAGMIGAFYGIGINRWASTEDIWEGVFALVASIIITIMGAALLRVSKLQDKWRVKLAKALEAKDERRRGTLGQRFKLWCEKYSLFLLPFITVIREGIEAVVFIGGVGLGLPPTAFPLAVICGLGAGALIGFFIYKGGKFVAIQFFLILSTCMLYLIAAGLFSKSVWFFENNKWSSTIGGDAAETGTGPGSYDIRQSVWHVDCCSPYIDGGGGWGIFNALLGWQNSATYGSVISYNLYWVVVIAWFVCLRFKERNGRWPLMKAKPQSESGLEETDSSAEGRSSRSGSDLEAGKANMSHLVQETKSNSS